MSNVKSHTRATPAPDRHLNFLDGIRGLSALFVTAHHMWLQLWPQTYHALPTGLMLAATGWLGYGHFAVTVFIVLSGFSLAFSAAQRNRGLAIKTGEFHFRRARRILPPYYFALILSCTLALTVVANRTGTHWDVSLPVTGPGLASHLFMLQDVFYVSQINHTFWSIALEWKLYFLFPLLLAACSRIGPVVTSIGCTMIGYIGLVLLHGTAYNNFPIHFIGLFAMGTAGGVLVSATDAQSRKLCQSRLLTAVGVLSLLVVLGASWIDYLRGLFYTDLFVALATIVGLLKMATGGWRALKAAFAWKPLAFVGTFAYSLYLVHAPLIQCFWQYLVHPLELSKNAEFLVLVLLGAPAITACAYVFYLVCERPFIRSQRAKKSQKESAVRPALEESVTMVGSSL